MQTNSFLLPHAVHLRRRFPLCLPVSQVCSAGQHIFMLRRRRRKRFPLWWRRQLASTRENLEVERTPDDDPLQRMARRRREERPRYYKIVLPRGVGGTQGWCGITVPFGNHTMSHCSVVVCHPAKPRAVRGAENHSPTVGRRAAESSSG